MPKIKFVEVLSYSSESPSYPADNLLKSDEYCKWKCKEGTEDKQSWVTLKLEKLVTINAIDIGNDNSALIEVLVGREGIDFKVLLVASSFMTPLEARNGTGTNRVRIFEKEKLSKHVVDQKWDRIKVVCTQPFAKNVQYGLSFIKIHSAQEKEEPNKSSDVKIGRFILKEDADNSAISVGSIFNLRKEERQKTPLKGAAAIRAASNDLAHANETSKNKSTDANAPSLGFYQLQKQSKEPVLTNSEKLSSPTINQKDKVKNDKPRTEPLNQPSNSSIKKTEKPSTKIINRKRKSKPFSCLFQGVIFVMSGYKNPQRSNLRDKMLEMGAKYKADWDDSCTHLICAFTNTPKFLAVKGHGKIVSEKWIEDSYRKKVRLPWRRFNLEKNRNADESEEEIYANEIMPKEEGSEKISKDDDEEMPASSDGENTDEEIERIMNKNTKDSKRKNQDEPKTANKMLKKHPDCDSNIAEASDDEIYDADTDVDEVEEKEVIMKKDTSNLSLPPLKDFLQGKVFFFYGSKGEEWQKNLYRYIRAHGGKVKNYMGDDVQYVITESPWDDHFEEALNGNSALQFVKPQWIWQCCDKQRCVPPQPFLVVPLDEDS